MTATVAAAGATMEPVKPVDLPSYREVLDEYRYRFTREQADRLTELGFFGDQRVQWIGGEFYLMAAISYRHAMVIDEMGDLLMPVAAPHRHVKRQNPVGVAEQGLPEPDLAVIPGKRSDYTDHPTRYDLIVEVSRSTYAFDRRVKWHLYAASAAPEYWIANLNADRVEVYRQPTADPDAPNGWAYASQTDYSSGDVLRPLFAEPQTALKIDDLLMLSGT